jgi:hypothetical protein
MYVPPFTTLRRTHPGRLRGPATPRATHPFSVGRPSSSRPPIDQSIITPSKVFALFDPRYHTRACCVHSSISLSIMIQLSVSASNILGGAMFCKPIILDRTPRPVLGCVKTIVIGRHAFGDWRAVSPILFSIFANLRNRSINFVLPGPGNLQLVYTPGDDSPSTKSDVYDFKGRGVAMSMYERAVPAKSCSPICCSQSQVSRIASFNMALAKKMPLVGYLRLFLRSVILMGRWKKVHVHEKQHHEKI